jgi:hypothetical protein
MIALWPLLSRLWPYLAGVAVIIAAVVWIDARGAQRARDERAVADAALYAKIDARLSQIDTQLADNLARIDRTETIVKPTLIREINSAPRYSDPAAGITPSMLHQLNAARAASCATGTDCGTVPATSTDK